MSPCAMKLHTVKGYRIKINLDAEWQSKSQQTRFIGHIPQLFAKI